MTNNDRFNVMLNSCQHPRAMYNALYALAPVISKTLMQYVIVQGWEHQTPKPPQPPTSSKAQV